MITNFLLHHEHAPGECGVAFAAWRGFASPLSHQPTIATCREGGHAIWWLVEAPDPDLALEQLPPYVAERTRAIPISQVRIP